MARVLVVDENPQVRRFLCVSLETCGHRVAEADNASDGLRLCQGRKYDLIILDTGVPSRPTLIVTEPGVGYRLKTSGDPLSKGDGS
jgi:DNA-binding response OmpR family regulator